MPSPTPAVSTMPSDPVRGNRSLTSPTIVGKKNATPHAKIVATFSLRRSGFFPQYTLNTLQLNQGVADDGRVIFSEVARMAGVARLMPLEPWRTSIARSFMRSRARSFGPRVRGLRSGGAATALPPNGAGHGFRPAPRP